VQVYLVPMVLVHRKRLFTAKGPAILRKTALGGIRSTLFLVRPSVAPPPASAAPHTHGVASLSVTWYTGDLKGPREQSCWEAFCGTGRPLSQHRTLAYRSKNTFCTQTLPLC
jgi:hypothetical protein